MVQIPRSPTRKRLPKWFKRDLAKNGVSSETDAILRKYKLVTVCEEATCPNKNECYSKNVATFMLLGDTCTRTCTFCDVKTSWKLPPPDNTEPQRIADAVGELGLQFVVLTSVNRDDLDDGGAEHFAQSIYALRKKNPHGLIEVLTPDFCGNEDALQTVIDAAPDVFNHNLETIPRLYKEVRPQAQYQRSLTFLQTIKTKNPKVWTKSGIMVGLGETDDEVRWVMEDMRKHQVDICTIGQYLRPSLKHHDIMRFVEPDQFELYKQWGQELGFHYTAAGPYVRSSYFAEEVLTGAAKLG
ncbi:MAG: lipoyl synthase [Planctomycetes bacterium]|nr:lipoyl synthase [Planctomycetota bacterium]